MVRLPPLNALKAFEAASRHQSFKDAADELCVTQGAVSRHIQKLEMHLGVALFDRAHRRVTLTSEGVRYVQDIREAFRRVSEATEAIVEECVSIVQLLNPQQAILSGWIAENESYFELLKTKIQSRETGKLRRPTPITAAHWKLQGAAVGAATLGLHHIFRMREVD